MNLYKFEGVICKTGLKEAIFVLAQSQSEALAHAMTFAKDIVFIREDKVRSDWN